MKNNFLQTNKIRADSKTKGLESKSKNFEKKNLFLYNKHIHKI